MKYSKDETDTAYAQLLTNESALRFSAALFGGILTSAVIFTSLVVYLERAPIYLVPVIITGFVYLLGNIFSTKYRLITGVSSGLMYLLSALFFEGTNILIWFTPIVFGLSFLFAKRKLSKLEKASLWLKGLER